MTPIPETLILRGPDLERAVVAGVMPRDTAENLVDFIQQSPASGNEDENLRLVTGFGDIFVTIGLGLFLGALAFLTSSYWSVALAIAAWGLAEIFTRWKRMALPSIALLLAFGGAVFLGVMNYLTPFASGSTSIGNDGWPIAAAGLASLAAVALHWWRFRVPVTIAAGAAAGVALVAGLVGMAAPMFIAQYPPLIFIPLGLAVFATAMFYDMSDLARRTPRTDIAFWLHMLAAPIIVHPIVQLFDGPSSSTGSAVGVIVMFAILGLIALVVDRRALLVSSLIYLGYALSRVMSAGGEMTTTAFPVLLVGTTVLTLSLAWRPLRSALLRVLPSAITQRVPAAGAIYPKAKASV